MSDFEIGYLTGGFVGAVSVLILVVVFERLGVVEWLIIKMDEWVANHDKR